MTNDKTNKIITNIIPTDIAANMKYITCPYLFQFQKKMTRKSANSTGKISEIVPGVIQNRFHFSLWGIFFKFWKNSSRFSN